MIRQGECTQTPAPRLTDNADLTAVGSLRSSASAITAARAGSGPAGDNHRCPGRVDHRGADRTQQHPGEPAAAVAADDDQLRRVGPLNQLAGRPIAHDDTAHIDVGIAFLPAGQPLR